MTWLSLLPSAVQDPGGPCYVLGIWKAPFSVVPDCNCCGCTVGCFTTVATLNCAGEAVQAQRIDIACKTTDFSDAALIASLVFGIQFSVLLEKVYKLLPEPGVSLRGDELPGQSDPFRSQSAVLLLQSAPYA